ncbi:MAG: type II toxin-antitoxin system VapC family toxin [Nitrososphaerota archaeon]|jgi:predicted nucleic acid-binding protein|nr:type II toxin-antitoxin system VapC family toxin [Nitrososphaerota archaeon]
MPQKQKPTPTTDPLTVFVDTSIIVDIDRGKQTTIELCKQLTHTSNAYISTVSVSEILTGSYLRKDHNIAVKKAEKVLNQFRWVSLNGETVKLIAELNAYLIAKGQPIEYPDVAIAASFLVEDCDILLTENKEHFERLPNLKDKVMTAKEFCQKITEHF